MPHLRRALLCPRPRIRSFQDFTARLAQLVEPGGRVLDVGCGTGNLAFRTMAPDAAEVVGIELSPAMAEYANQRRSDEGLEHVSFVLGDVVHAFRDRAAGYFDVATMVLVLHEMPAEARTPVLRKVTRVAKRLLCLDYRVPMPWNLAGARNRLLEAATGREHFGAFRAFLPEGWHRRGRRERRPRLRARSLHRPQELGHLCNS